MAYLKPQSPIKFQEDHIYPLTTADQVILEDGSRWDGGAEANEKIENAQSMANDALSKAEDALSKVDDVVNSSGVQSVNGKKGDVTLDASDVGAAPASHRHYGTDVNPYIHDAVGIGGEEGFVRIARFTIIGEYGNAPFQLLLSQRKVGKVCHVNIAFDGYQDAGLPHFTVDNLSYYCYMHKAAASTWDLYVLKKEGWDEIGVVGFNFPDYLIGRVSVEWTNDQVSTLPSGYVQAWLETSQYTFADVGAASASHTHTYAGSDSVGGAANSLSLPKGIYNLNTMHVDGGDVVTVEADAASTNLPEDQWYYVQSFRGTDSYGHQIAYRESANEIWHRNLSGGNWNTWQKIYDTGNKPTYSDVGAAAASHNHSGTYLPLYREAVDVNTVYNARYTAVTQGTNCPSGSPYGSLLTMPYQAMSGQTKPGFATQIFIPNGDDSKNPNDMFYRTSGSDSWSSWNKVWASNNLKFSLSGSTLSITTT